MRTLPFLNAAIKAWWVAEYSGWYMEDAAGSGLPGIDIDAGEMRIPSSYVCTGPANK